MTAVALGREIEIASPARPLKVMSWGPVWLKPDATLHTPCSKVPVIYINLEPTTSETEPESSNVQPHTRELIEAGLQYS